MKKTTRFLILFLFTSVLFSQDIAITDFVLVNADTNEDLMVISEGTQINLYEYPGIQFNIRANGTTAAKSVRFQLSGALVKTATESVAPYALYGDFPTGSYYGQDFPVGGYTLSAVPYSLSSAGGSAGNTVELNFAVIATPLSRPFITTWKTDNPGSSDDNQITIPTFPGETYNYTVDWGDGTSESGITGDVTHTYDTPGSYQISILGDFPRIYFHNNFDSNYEPGPGDKDKLIEVNQWGDITWTSMKYAFYGCTSMNVVATDIPDFSNLSSLSFMFAYCKTLEGNETFDEWDIRNVDNTSYMFSGAELFNQNIGGWDTSNVVRMQAMFTHTNAFNQPIGSWDLSSATIIGAMFFDATAFNQDIGLWKFPKVTELPNMFGGALSFNQDISTWDVSGVSNFGGFLANTPAFDQDLSNWNVSNATVLSSIFTNSGLSDENYDKILIGWSQLPSLQNGVQMDANLNAYCNAVDERQLIIDTYGWIINDLGQAFNCGLNQQRPFVMVWKTDNSGSSQDNQVTIPTFSGQTYNYFVDWGDGTSSEGVMGDITHTYQNPGTYTISILGEFPRVYFDNGGDSQKLLRVEQWGDIEWTSMESAFKGCSMMDVLAIDVPDLTLVSSMKGMFQECDSFVGNSWISNWDTAMVKDMSDLFRSAGLFNQSVGSWDVGNVQAMNYMFASASSFNQHLASWNVSSVEGMDAMLDGTLMSTLNYDRTLIAWKNGSTLQQNVRLGAGGLKYCQGTIARQNLIDTYNWGIFDDNRSTECAVPARPFITTWKTDNLGSSNNNQITIATSSNETYDFTVVWGDGTISENVTESITHTYAQPGIYTIAISGFYPTPYFNNRTVTSDIKKLIRVEQWGDIPWSTMFSAFDGCANMDVVATDLPDFSNVKSTRAMFANCTALVGTSSFQDWNMSQVTRTSGMFKDAELFNQDISSWDMGNVESVHGMFQGATNFNQPIGSWDMNKVTSMMGMFEGATSFNQPLNDWGISGVNNLWGLFFDASSFNQPLDNWNVSAVTNMNYLFNGASAFDQDVSSWNVTQVKDMVSMFWDTGLSMKNYDLVLSSWSAQALQNDVNFSAGNSQYCEGEEARQKLIDDFGWIITDGGKAENCEDVQRPFITTWKTDNLGVSDDNQITILARAAGYIYDYTVDWGDGSSSLNVTGEIIHTYAVPGVYQVAISGDFPAIILNDESDIATRRDAHKLISIDQWGDIEWQTMERAFEWGDKMEILAMDAPDLSKVTSMSRMFGGCLQMKGNASVGAWDVSNIEDMGYMFASTSFDQTITQWNVSKVTQMSGMFASTPFNGNIANWNVFNVSDLKHMFFSAKNFNQDLSEWEVSNVKDMGHMFDQSGLTVENYDSTLIGWSSNPLQPNVSLGSGGIQYCQAEKARQKLIDEFGWRITDGGIATDCTPCPTTQITLSTQQQIDDFALTYDVSTCAFEEGILIEGTDIVNLDGLSGLTYIDGFLIIANTRLTNIDGLSSLTEVSASITIESNSQLTDVGGLSSIMTLGDLSIINNELLTNVDGLSSLNSISNFLIADNTVLNNLDGLNALTLVFGSLVIENNSSLSNLDGLSSLLGVSDSLIISNNTSLANLDGLVSLVFLDDNLIIEWNPVLANIDGLSHLSSIGLSLTIKSNSVLINFDGLASIITIGGDLRITDNDMLTSLNGLSNLNSIGGELNIIGNVLLSNCAVDAVCDSDTTVGGAVTISDNTGDCTDESAVRVACIGEVEVRADLLDATYLQGSINPKPTGPILRVEEGNRVTYLKFDMSEIKGSITQARLEMQVISDPGNGTLEVFLGSDSNWSETGLNGANKPLIAGNSIATLSGAHALNQTKVWNLDVTDLPTNRELTLIIKHSNGNDVAFASDETSNAPKLILTTGIGGPVDVDGDGYFSDVDCNDSDPAIHPDALEICDGIDNNCNGLIDDEDASVSCGNVEGVADLIEATFLQGSSNPSPTGPILRTEQGNRATYMKFDLSAFSGSITKAQLTMQVASDPGNGVLEVFLGSTSNWTETGLNGSNKPVAVGSAIGSISGTHSLGQTKIWELNVERIPNGGLVTLIMKHSNGNDVAFASDETSQAPQFMITAEGVHSGLFAAKKLTISPNPSSVEASIRFDSPTTVGTIWIFDSMGRLVQTMNGGLIDNFGRPLNVRDLATGIYYLRTQDLEGNDYFEKIIIGK